MNIDKLQKDIGDFWDSEIIPTLTDYIKIPNKSPAFDPNWEENGHMNSVLRLAQKWIDKHKPSNSTVHIKKADNRTPLILIEIPGERDGNVLMYGHLDKQPEMEGWRDGLGPWTPVLKMKSFMGAEARMMGMLYLHP